MENYKLTEDEVILLLIDWLKSKDWVITDYCLGHTRGIDITAKKNSDVLYIEAKGARASSSSPIRKRKKFDSGQIRGHLGKAIVKSVETQIKHPSSIVAIAHPMDVDLFNICDPVFNELEKLKIYKFWVSKEKVLTNLYIC